MTFRLSTDLFRHLTAKDLSEIVIACLGKIYDERASVALGHFRILLRFFEVFFFLFFLFFFFSLFFCFAFLLCCFFVIYFILSICSFVFLFLVSCFLFCWSLFLNLVFFLIKIK